MKKLKILCLCLSLLFLSSFFVSCKTKKNIYSADSMEFTVAEKIEEIDEKNSSSLDDEVIKALAVIIRTKLVNGENLTALDDDYYCQNSCSENENLKTETASSENSLSKNYNEDYYKNSESESASIKNNFSESNFINSSSVNLNDKFSNASMENSRTETFETENTLTKNTSNEKNLTKNALTESTSNENSLTENKNASSDNGSVNTNENNNFVNLQDSSDSQNLRFKHIYNLVKQTAGKILVKSSISNLKTTNSNSAKNLTENSNSANNALSTNSQNENLINENNDSLNGNIDDNISKNSNSNGERNWNSQNLNESNLQKNGESSTQENCSVNYTFDRQNFCWTKTIAKSSILKFLNKKNISLANISNIEPVYDENNSLKELSFASKNIPFSEIKENFNLNSSFITGLDNNLSSIIISGKSVDDGNVFDIFEAQKNAHLGQNFKQLLNNFFDGFILKTL